jgi:hypothetical protein
VLLQVPKVCKVGNRVQGLQVLSNVLLCKPVRKIFQLIIEIFMLEVGEILTRLDLAELSFEYGDVLFLVVLDAGMEDSMRGGARSLLEVGVEVGVVVRWILSSVRDM